MSVNRHCWPWPRGLHEGTKPLVERYIGISPEASAGESLAAGIGAELGLGPADDAFDLLARGLPDTAAVLIIDGLDLLGQDDEFLRFRWLPQAWPPGLHLVMSTRHPADAQRLSRQQPAAIRIELGPMAPAEAGSLFDVCLHDAGRTVNPQQHAVTSAAIRRCPLPLFVRILAELASRWPARDQVTLDVADLRGIIAYAFDELSADYRHGAVLVSAALRFLAVSRFGLADAELLDALSHDDDVMAAFRARHPSSPDIGHLPYIIWSSLRDDLAPYLAWRAIAGVDVADFFHSELRETARERYFPPGEAGQIHARLAAMFSREGTGPDDHWLEESQRAAGEVTHHLLEADDTRRFDDLTERADYLRAVAGHRAFYAGRSEPRPRPADDLIGQLRRRGRGDIAEALSAAGDMLAVRPEALPQVVQGAGVAVRGPLATRGVGFRRVTPLPPLVNDHGTAITTALACPDGAFLATGDADGRVAWRATADCEPLWCQAGHGSWVTALALSPDGAWLVSAGDDGAVMLWNVATGHREAICLPPPGLPMPQASRLVFVDDTHVIVRRDAEAYRCDIESGHVSRPPGDPFTTRRTSMGDHVAFSPGGEWCVESQSGLRRLTATDLAVGAQRLDVELGDTVASVAVSAGGLLLASTAHGLLRYDLRSPATPPQTAPGPVMDSLSAAGGGFFGLNRPGRQVTHVDDELTVSVVFELHIYARALPRFVRYLDPGRVAISFESGQVEVRAIPDGRVISSNKPALRLSGGTTARDGKQGVGWLTPQTEIITCALGHAPVIKATPHNRNVIAAADAGNGQLVTADSQGTMAAWHDDRVVSTWTIPVPVSSLAEWKDEEGIAVGTADCRVQLLGPRPAEVDIRSSLRAGRVAVNALDAAGNPPRIAAVLRSGLVAWTHDGEVSWRPADPQSTVAGTAVALLADGVSDGNELGRIRLWGQDRDKPVLEWDAHRGAVAWVGPIGDYLASAGADGTIFLIDIPTAEVMGAMHVNGGITAVRALSASELIVLSGPASTFAVVEANFA